MENIDFERRDVEKLRIGFLSFYYPHLGGSGIVATRLARHLAEQGHKIHFIGYDTDENPQDMVDLGVQLHRVRKVDYSTLKNEPYSWTLASRILNVHDEFGLDVIHANYALPHSLAAFAARQALARKDISLPYVVTGHGSDIHTNGAKYDVNPILQLCLNEADGLTFVSQDLQDIAKESLGITRPSYVIPNFVERDIFNKRETDLRSRLGIPESAFVIGHASNFTPVKQVLHFGYLAEHLKAQGVLDNIYFLMVGDGKDRQALEERMRKVEAGDHARFLGKLEAPELVHAYNAMDVFVLPSKHEGNPLTLLEAMACQVPVVGSDVGGIRDTIGNEGGFLFPFGDMPSLSKIIGSLRNDPSFRERVGREGLEKVTRDHSVEGVIGSYLQVYEKVLGGKHEALVERSGASV